MILKVKELFFFLSEKYPMMGLTGYVEMLQPALLLLLTIGLHLYGDYWALKSTGLQIQLRSDKWIHPRQLYVLVVSFKFSLCHKWGV